MPRVGLIATRNKEKDAVSMRCPRIRAARHGNQSREEATEMIRTVLAMAAVAVGVTAVMAQSDPVSQRKALMKGNGQHAGAVSKMVKGEEPFDAAKVTAAFAQWTETAQKLPGLFPEPPKPGEETRALPTIWDTRRDFEAKITAFSKAV